MIVIPSQLGPTRLHKTIGMSDLCKISMKTMVDNSPEVVLVALLDHGDHDDKEEGEEPRLGRDGRVYDPGQDQRDLHTQDHQQINRINMK